MKHLFIDFETFGRKVHDCAVIDCSVFIADTDRFTSDNPYTMKSIVEAKRFKLSVKDQVANHNFVVYKDGLEFWEKQNDAVKAHIKPKKSDITVEEFVNEFLQFLIDSGKIDYWWSRSNTFDPIILWRLIGTQDKFFHANEYIPFWRVRDIRTYIDTKFDFENNKNGFTPIADEDFWNKVFKEHDSSWDVLADVLRMQAIVRAENDLEMVNR